MEQFEQAHTIIDRIFSKMSTNIVVQQALCKVPIIWCIKDQSLRMVYFSKMYGSKYIKPFNMDPADYIGKTDVEYWGEKIGSTYQKNDVEVLKTGNPVIVKEPVKSKGKEQFEEFIKYRIKVDGKYYLCLMQINVDAKQYIKAYNSINDKNINPDNIIEKIV